MIIVLPAEIRTVTLILQKFNLSVIIILYGVFEILDKRTEDIII